MYDYMNNYNPYMRMNQNQLNQNQPQQLQIIKVNGENGARSFRMMPNSQALLLDDTAPIVWLCQSDGAGYHTVTPYSITPYEQPQAVDYTAILNSFDERLKKLEGNYESNNKPDGKTKQKSNADATGI